MLGSVNEGDDAVQETWLRVLRVDNGYVEIDLLADRARLRELDLTILDD
jgi:DNA-directed RNA polymerase specialized sigma24 family protein